MRDEIDEASPAPAFGTDDWFDGTDRRPAPVAPATVAAALVPLEAVDDRGPLAPSAPAALVRRSVRGTDTHVLDQPFPANRPGRRWQNVDAIFRLGPLGGQLLAAVVRQCHGKAPGNWKNAITALSGLATILAGCSATSDGDTTLPADILERYSAALLAGRDALNQSAVARLRLAASLLRRLPSAGHVILKVDDAVDEGGSDGDSEDDLEGPTDLEIEDLIRSVMSRVLRTMAADEQVRAGEEGREVGGPLDSEVVRGAVYLRRHHPDRAPTLPGIKARDPAAAALLRRAGFVAAKRAAYPTKRDMVPFLVLLGFYTRLNPTVLCSIRLDQISRDTRLGQRVGVLSNAAAERISFDPYKPRSGRHQHVSFAITDEPDNPDALVRFVERWTAPIRPAAGASGGRLFIFVQTKGLNPIGDFVFRKLDFAIEMKPLCLDAGIRPLTPKQLRPASVDAIFQASGGDMALVRAAGWWKDVSTPEKVYLGPRTRRRGEEDLAFAVLLEERRRHFGIDVANRPDWMDRGAATPGWICYDPHGGPLRTRRGELCSAIGHCPLCPNSDLDDGSPRAFAWVVALGLAILAKRETMPEEHWRAKWEPILDGIVIDWLPLFGSAVVDAARALPAVTMEDF